MIGDKYWSTGITLRWDGRGNWSAGLKFYDGGFCDHESTEGELHTRYFVGLELALDTLIADARRLGIEMRQDDLTGAPFLYYETDGESEDWPPPENWQEMLCRQAERIGYCSYDALEPVTA